MGTGGWGRDGIDEWAAAFCGAVARGEFGWAHRLMDGLSQEREDRIRWVLGRAMLYARQREYTAALDVVRGWLDTAAAEDPFRSELEHAHADYAAVGFLAGAFPAAATSPLLRTAAAAAAADPTRSPACPVTVALDVQEGRSEQALSRLRRHRRASLLGDRRTRANADVLIAVCLAELGDLAEAEKAIRRATRIAPGLALIPMARAHVAAVAGGVADRP
ncbi:hypothetical protein [Embleya sp. AB8]|uniref:hypothetical protein n=1 Tax=Embleya sp. AB8 TaxID=3156304 RepID=UPI003C7623E6